MNAINVASLGKAVVQYSLLMGFIDKLEGLELPPDGSSDVLGIVECAQEPFQLEKLAVILVIKPRFNGDSIVYLIAKGVGGVVHENSLRQIPAQHI